MNATIKYSDQFYVYLWYAIFKVRKSVFWIKKRFLSAAGRLCMGLPTRCASDSAAISASARLNKRSRWERISSVDSFNQKSQPNEMLNGLRYFERPVWADPAGSRHAAKEAFPWGNVSAPGGGRWGPFTQVGIASHLVGNSDSLLLAFSARKYLFS